MSYNTFPVAQQMGGPGQPGPGRPYPQGGRPLPPPGYQQPGYGVAPRPMPAPMPPMRPSMPQYQPQPQYQQPLPPAVAWTPAKPRKRRRMMFPIVTAFIAVLAVGGAGYYFLQGRPETVAAAVGDCVAQTGPDDVKTVGCADPTATFKVVGRLENRTMVDAGMFACTAFPKSTSSFWQGRTGQPGLVLCLAPAKA